MMPLVARDVTFGYRPRQTVIDGWSDNFQSGETVAVTGPSGCGKSSLLFLLGTMLRPRSGSILVDGHEVGNMSDSQRSRLRSRVFGFVFQDASLDPHRSVLDNILLPAAYRGERRAQWLDRAHTLVAAVGVEVPLERRPGEISGGQAQRIALARALLHEPRVILADEPTGNLDSETSTKVMEVLARAAHAGATVVIVTHDPEVVRACDRKTELTGSAVTGRGVQTVS